MWRDSPDDTYDTEPGLEWSKVLDLVTEATLSIVYDRAGVGRSDPLADADRPGGAPAAAAELHELLNTLGIADPVVLVGHSLGAVVGEAFARAWPGRTAGILAIDPTPPAFHTVRLSPELIEGRGGRIYNTPRDGTPSDHHPAFPAVPGVVLSCAIGTFLNVSPEDFLIPLDELDHRWQDWQHETARRLGARQVIAHRAPHQIHRYAPELVAYALDAVVRAVRGGRSEVSLDAEDANDAGGRLLRRTTADGQAG
jgi:hypothetical protein